jgi:hypothetical protein
MSRALSQGRIMLMTALVERRLRDAGLEHRARYMPSATETGDDWIEIVEIEGGVPASICLRGWRFGVRRYHHDDDGKVATTDYLGWFDTPSGAAALAAAVLRRSQGE